MTRAEAISRAFLRLLRFDPDVHDIFDVYHPCKGVRVATKAGEPLQFIGYKKALRLLDDEDNRRAMAVWIELEDVDDVAAAIEEESDAPISREEQADVGAQREDGDGGGPAAEAGRGDRLQQAGGDEAAGAEAAECIGATPREVME